MNCSQNVSQVAEEYIPILSAFVIIITMCVIAFKWRSGKYLTICDMIILLYNFVQFQVHLKMSHISIISVVVYFGNFQIIFILQFCWKKTAINNVDNIDQRLCNIVLFITEKQICLPNYSNLIDIKSIPLNHCWIV